MRSRRLSPTCLLALLGALGCTRAQTAPPPAPARGGEPSQVVGQVGGDTITLEEVDRRAAGRLQRLHNEEYEIRRDALDAIIVEKLLDKAAAERGLTREALLKAEVEDKVAALTPAEVKKFYDGNRAAVAGRSLEEVGPLIEREVRRQRVNERAAAYRDELKKKAGVKVTLEAPRVEVAIPADAPVLGPKDAPVTIVEYLDYQCPFCHRAQGVVDEIMGRYPGKVRFVHRDYLLGKPRSLAAARAARCAGEQGHFWEYHRNLLLSPGDMEDADLQKRAAEMGLDAAKFGTCAASERFDADIHRASESGQSLGIDSTPTFFINGRRLVGAVPADDFAEVIDEELARGKS
jgi:protein-disulfide isomerase